MRNLRQWLNNLFFLNQIGTICEAPISSIQSITALQEGGESLLSFAEFVGEGLGLVGALA